MVGGWILANCMVYLVCSSSWWCRCDTGLSSRPPGGQSRETPVDKQRVISGREREKEKKKERDRERDIRQKHRETERDRERQRETKRDRETVHTCYVSQLGSNLSMF
jgi:hypothetical protein